MNTARLAALVVAWAAAFGALAHGADLVPGLAYLRPGAEASPQSGSVVIDLRTVTDEAAATPLLAAVEAGAANDKRVLLALVSPETPEGVRRRVSALPRCLTIGRIESDFKTNIAVTTSADADRRAAQALASGTTPEKLLIENANKPRYDEASLMREHTTGIETASPAAPDFDPARPAASPAPESPPFDAVLQRAVHLYRGLSILKKT